MKSQFTIRCFGIKNTHLQTFFHDTAVDQTIFLE